MLGSAGSSYAQDVSGDEINALIIDLAESGQGGDLEALFDALSSYRAAQDWPDSDAIVTGQGDCTFVASSCNPDNHDADVTLPAVSNVHIIYPENTSTDVGTEFKVVWDPPVFSSGSQYALSRYEVALILGGKEYENFVVAPELQDDGSYQLKNSIRIRDRKPGRHYVHVRAIYETQSEGFSSGLSASLGQHLIAPSRGLSGEGFSGGFASTWGGGGFGDVVTPTKVQDLASVNAALHACVSAVYSATTSLNTINSLTCRNQNIADLEGIQHLSALRTLALSNGRTISGGNLPNHNTFTNLSKLFSLADLVTLDISNTSVSVSQIESLMDNVTSIESLRIAYIPLASFPDLRPQPGFGSTIITNLKILDISYTGLSSINTGTHKISDLNNLHALSASGNPLDKNFSLSSNSNLFEAILKDIDVHGSLSMANFPDNLDYLYLSDQPNTLGSNPFSELLTLIQNPSNSVAHAGIDHVLDLSGNTGMYCSNVKAVETWFWARTDACAANPFTGECTRPHLAVYSPSYCYPDKINNFSVYRNVSGAFVFNWDAVPNNWGVVRYEIDTYDSNNQQTRLEVTDTQSEQLVASYLAQDSVQFEMRACVAQQCGESTGLMTLSPDLTRAKNITSVWNGSSFQLKWQYPADVFNHSGGRGKPDYFLVLPASPKAGSPSQYQVNVTQNTISTSTNWTSSFLSPNNNTSNLYRIRACRLDDGVEYCGPSASVDVEPNQNASIAIPGNVNAVKSGIINRVFLSWDQVNDPTVDYYQIREDYEPESGDNRSQTQTRIFYSEKDSVSINRENNGDYRYQVRACRRDRSSAGDSCSTASPLTSEVTIATNPNNILTANTVAGASGWIPHSGGVRLALRLQNTTPSTVLPEYFKIEVLLDTNE
ncbi:MAG: hypothetical protein MI750_12330, partial [Xanthomonadales bacterium]|nr:hypothetical protein [Xanthomonadales bacterium]